MTLLSCHKMMRSHPWRWAFALALAVFLLGTAAAGFALSPAPGTSIISTATLQYKDAGGNPMPQLSASVSVPIAGAPLLQLSISADADPVAAGASLTYTISYANTGNKAATGVIVVDTLPAGVTFQSASSGGVYSAIGHSVTWNTGALTEGSGGSYTITVKANAGLAAGTALVSNAPIVSAEGAAANAAHTTTIGVGSNLILTKSSLSAQVFPGGLMDYVISYSNIGNSDALQVRITDQIPSGTAYVAGSASPAASLAVNILNWNIGTVGAGSGGVVRFQVRASPLAQTGDRFSNVAAIISASQAVASNAVVHIVPDRSLIIFKMDTPDPVRAGGNITYLIQVENSGTAPLTNVVIRDPLPSGTSFVSADNGGVYNALAKQVDWTIGALAVAQKKTVTLMVRVDPSLAEGILIDNTASVMSNETALQTIKAVSRVNARTAGVVEFHNAVWQPAYGYMSGDVINLQVKDSDQNLDPLVAETVTVVLKDFKTGDLETIILTETGPDTGVFRNGLPSSLAVSGPNSGTLTVAVNSRIQATYTDSLDATPVSTASALIDPLGIVFDSVTGVPVAGTVVTLRNWNGLANTCDLTSRPALPPGQVNPALPTGADGKFAFPLVPPGDFCFQVTPASGYAFPSAVPDTDLPAGFTMGNGSRGEKFTLSAGDPPLIRDIPVDPPTGRLSASKTASKTQAAIGDMLIYVIKLTNNGKAPVTALTVSDIMPHGIAYLDGSSKTNGAAAADPRVTGQRTLAWNIAKLAPAESVEITYRALVGPDSAAGTGVNTAVAAGMSLGKTVVSNTAQVKVKITEGVFTSKGTIIGRVFLDLDEDGFAGKDEGIRDVVLYLEDGTRVITDRQGKYSIAGVAAGTHVLRLDETTLPAGAKLIALSNRFMGDGSSQFIDMTPGGLFKANFAVRKGTMKPPEVPKENQERKETEKDGKVPSKESLTINDSITVGSGTGAEPVKIIPPAGAVAGTTPDTKASGETEASASTDRIAGTQPPPEAGKVPAPEAENVPTKDASELEKRILKFSPDLEFLSPADGAVLPRSSIHVLIKAPLDAALALTVNGAALDNKHIGKHIKYPPGRVAVYEFVDVRLSSGEENVIAAEVRDNFGIVRGAKQIRVTAVGETARMVVLPESAEAVADGQSRVSVNVSFMDRLGHAAPYSGAATVALSAGEILEQDADPSADGHQIRIRDGRGQFTVISPRETGQAKMDVQANGLTASAEIYFVPHLRPMLFVGVGEIVLGHGRSSGDLDYIKSRSWFNDGAYLNGRGAFFAKGNLYKDVLITAAYDSNKNRSDELFRESDTRLDSEDKYPIYGDESKTGYEALSREKLYVKLEKGKSYVLYGDYRTDLTETKLSSYTRSFNGLKLEVNTDRFKLRSFGTHTDQTQLVDTLPGKGTSGYYYLNSNLIIEGSERVVIETRDRLQPDRVLNREVKSRGSDYDIDYGLGSILFKAPVPSHDAGGNPVYIVATYESRKEGAKYYIYGGRGSFRITDWLNVGATGIVEEKAISNYQLFGGDMTLKLPGNSILKAEYANTRALFDINSAYETKSGEGWSVNVESRPLNRLSLTGFYRDIGDYFSNPSASDAVSGTRKFGFDAAYELQPTLTLRAKYLDEKDRINDSSHRLASVGATKKFVKTTISAELTHETAENLTATPAQTPSTPGGLLNGVPFLNAYETPDRATFAKLDFERELITDLSLSLGHKQDLGGNGYFVSQGGLNYQLNKSNRLYIREEYAKYQQGTQTRTLLGAESQVIKNTTAYSEFRLADGSAGYRNQQVIGLKNKFEIIKGVNANIAGEYLSTLSGQKNPNEPDAYAAAASVDYLTREDFKITGRAEHRHEIVENGMDSYLAEVAAAYKLHPDYSLLARERYFIEQKGSDQNNTSRLLLGLAYRPLDNDRFHALGKVEYKYEKRATAQPAYSLDSFIASAEGVYQFTSALQVMGKYAGKMEKDDEFSSYTDLIATRLMFDLTERFDFGVEYRLLTSHRTNTRLHGGAVEFGCRIVDQLWLSLGYSFDRFDEDLVGDSYHGEGPYLKVRFKFDEKTLRKLNPLADKNPPLPPQAVSSMGKALSSYLNQ